MKKFIVLTTSLALLIALSAFAAVSQASAPVATVAKTKCQTKKINYTPAALPDAILRITAGYCYDGKRIVRDGIKGLIVKKYPSNGYRPVIAKHKRIVSGQKKTVWQTTMPWKDVQGNVVTISITTTFTPKGIVAR